MVSEQDIEQLILTWWYSGQDPEIALREMERIARGAVRERDKALRRAELAENDAIEWAAKWDKLKMRQQKGGRQ
jgi:hypothetical protein